MKPTTKATRKLRRSLKTTRPQVLNVTVARRTLALRLHQFDEATSDAGVEHWMTAHTHEVRPIDLEELSSLIEAAPRELTSLVGKFDIVPYGCYVDSGEARLPALPVLTQSGKIEKSPNWTRPDHFKWPPATRFLFVELN